MRRALLLVVVAALGACRTPGDSRVSVDKYLRCVDEADSVYPEGSEGREKIRVACKARFMNRLPEPTAHERFVRAATWLRQ